MQEYNLMIRECRCRGHIGCVPSSFEAVYRDVYILDKQEIQISLEGSSQYVCLSAIKHMPADNLFTDSPVINRIMDFYELKDTGLSPGLDVYADEHEMFVAAHIILAADAAVSEFYVRKLIGALATTVKITSETCRHMLRSGDYA